MQENGSHDAALWTCAACGSWWCSQPALAPTSFLHQLPAELAATLEWDAFRGWAVGRVEDVAVCPECETASSGPVYGDAGQATRRQPVFALHAARGMSVRNMRQSGFVATAGD